MKQEFLEIGKAVNTHGVRGEVKVEPWCDAPEVLMDCRTIYLDATGAHSLKVDGARLHGKMVLLTIRGVDTLEKAERLKNSVLYCRREDLPLEEDAYFLQDLLGCRVVDEATGETLGDIEDVSNYGASDVWQIRRPTGPVALIPNIPEVVRELHLEEGYVTIHRMKGLFEDDN